MLQSCSLAQHSRLQTTQLLTIFMKLLMMPKSTKLSLYRMDLCCRYVADARNYHLRQNCTSSKRMDTVCRMVKTWYRYISFLRCSSRTTYPSIPAALQCHFAAMTLWTRQVKCKQVALSMCIALGFSPTPEVVLSQLGVDQGYSIVQVE